MLDWLKQPPSRDGRPSSLCLHVSEVGLSWNYDAKDAISICPLHCQSLLDQLESDGLIAQEQDAFSTSWENVFAIIRHPEYVGVTREIGIPEVVQVAPRLESVGTLTDADFGISITDWNRPDGATVQCRPVVGPLLWIENHLYLMPRQSWQVNDLVTRFWTRPGDERSETFNRRAWGTIRQSALDAGCQLGQFLFRSVVLTPKKLQIQLNRIEVGRTKVVEVIPSFAGCPEGWLAQFDVRSTVPDRFDVATAEGVVQIIITPQIKTVLRQIKQMPARRVAGSRAEGFVRNPFATLGGDASATIDPEQFERALADAGITFEQFHAHIEKDAFGNPARVGILIETSGDATSSVPSSILHFFESNEELEAFVDSTQKRLNAGLQVSAWKEYEFDLSGDTELEIQLLRDALRARKIGFGKITFAQVYDLSAYSQRVEDIGTQKLLYSPFIAKKDDGEGWFPDNLIPVIVWTPEDGSAPVALPVNPEFEDLIRKKIDHARSTGELTIDLPTLPKAIPLSEAENLIKAFDKVRRNPPLGPEGVTGPAGIGESEKPKPPTLVIKANIVGVDYEETRRELLEAYSPTPYLPKALRSNVTLKDHQLSGIAWLQHLFSLSPSSSRGAVLADDMGLGKTLQLLTLLAGIFEQDPSLPPALVVAPVSLLENWQEEIKTFFIEGSMPIAVIYGEELQSLRISRSAIDQALLDQGLVKFLKPGWVGSARIVLTTYETLRDLEFSFAAERWSVLICDEAQKIKNPNALMTRAAKKQNVRFKIACTGTPVENTLADLWCLFDLVQPGMLGALNDFGQRYRKPIEAKTEEEKARVEELRERIKPQILRRTKKEVAKDLPNKIVSEACRSLAMSSHQLSLYTQAVDLFRRRNDPGVRTPFKNHLGLLHYLRVVCTDPRAIGSESSTVASLNDYRKRTPKLDWLINELDRIRSLDEKAIVFCEFRGVQRVLRHYISETFGFAPDVINGDTEASASHQNSRQKRLRAFQKKRGFGVIILSPIAVGFGVNIQAANHVIHYTRTWNPAKEDQATDRAYRIGQTRDVHVYYPVVTAPDFTTFDVKLDHLLDYKRELAQDMLNGTGDIKPGDLGIDEVIPRRPGEPVNSRVGLEELLSMNAKYFEGLAAALWVARGYGTVYRTPDTGDEGVDVVALAGTRGALIQCKSSADTNRALGWDAIKDVVAGLASYQRRHPNVDFELICVTNQRFNSNAKEQALLRKVSLFEQSNLAELLEQHDLRMGDIEKFLYSSWSDADS